MAEPGGPDDPRPPAGDGGVRGSVLRGSALMLTMRWVARLTGLVSTIILVRLLSPEDFGLVVMAMLVVELVELLSDTAVDLALIRHRDPQRAHFDSAWSVSAIVGVVLAVALLIMASPVSVYFTEPRVELIIFALSLKTGLVGFENIGVVWFRRNLDFVSEFRYGVIRKVVPKFVTVGLAFVFQDYRALVYGEMFAAVFGLALSYVVHPYRPRIDFSKVRELWSFSIWILIADVGEYMHRSVGRLVIGSATDAARLGQYSIAEELAHLPRTELVGPLSRPLYPAYAKFHDDREDLRDAYLDVLSVTAIIAASTATGIAVVSGDLLGILFGAQWVAVAPTLGWIAIGGAVGTVCSTALVVLNALGLARQTAIVTWSAYAVILTGLITAAQYTTVLADIAAVEAGLTVLLAPIYFLQLRRFLPLRWIEIGVAIWRPIVAASLMAAVLFATKYLTDDLNAVVRLAFEVILGSSVFSATLAVLWIANGRPKGAEHAGVELLLQAKQRFWGPNS